MASAFYHNQEQKAAIAKSRAQVASRIKGEIHTRALPFTGFALAEDSHQKHDLKRTPWAMEEFRRMYSDSLGIVDSTAAARVNGYLAGFGGCDRLEAEIQELGLSAEGSRRLLRAVCGGDRAESRARGGGE